LPVPTLIVIAPPIPPTAAPLPKFKAPEKPAVVAPLLNINFPLAPAVPPFVD